MESLLNKYIREHSGIPCGGLDWIEKQTNLRTNYPQMLSGTVQGELLKILVGVAGARRILEIGTFTGYSAACMASVLPPDGYIDTLEINDEMVDVIREGWIRAGVSDKISLHTGDAVELLQTLEGPYDFVFMDADKRQYCLYYDSVKRLLKKGGLLVADDVLWDGKVYSDPPAGDAQTRGLLKFNDMVRDDPDVEAVMLPLRDGISLIRKR